LLMCSNPPPTRHSDSLGFGLELGQYSVLVFCFVFSCANDSESLQG